MVLFAAKQQSEMESTDQLEGDEEGVQQESVWKRKKRDFDRYVIGSTGVFYEIVIRYCLSIETNGPIDMTSISDAYRSTVRKIFANCIGK